LHIHNPSSYLCKLYRGADKSLDRPDCEKQFTGHSFSPDAEVIAVAET